ncbi:MAG: FecR domain-containing protein [Chitinophagaceae bacterium]|nr:FecR domain-containing protein [Chitinophagaceae bacterium]
MNEIELGQLLQNYLDGSMTAKELSLLRKHASDEKNAPSFNLQIEQAVNRRMASGLETHADLSKMYEEILSQDRRIISPVHRVHFLKTRWFRYAAAIILLATTATFLWPGDSSDATPKPDQLSAVKIEDIEPGGNRALLTLANGRTIVLDSVGEGDLARQGAVTIIKAGTGVLAYTGAVTQDTGTSVLYNTITTPRGGQYQVILQDGTKVWLNAASEVRFPAGFPANERRIELSGEAYCEIAVDKNRPFYISAGNTAIQVLGTSFNINAYLDEEAVKTTLVEGSIRIGKGSDVVLLQRGEQALVKNNNPIHVKRNTNVAEVLAWKNGLFTFEEADVAAVMRQLSRWYNVDVVYKGSIPSQRFIGKIFRGMSLSKVVKVLANNGINCRIEGRKLIVQP